MLVDEPAIYVVLEQKSAIPNFRIFAIGFYQKINC